jgi:uncharacterized membrane protein
MNTMSIRDELRTYSKSDLTRVAIAATRKQYAAEQALKRARWSIAVIAFLLGVLVGIAGLAASFVWGV